MSVIPPGVERRRGGDDDRERHQVGERHSDVRVQSDALDGVQPLVRRLHEWPAFGRFPDVLDLLRRLPEKQIRADRRPQHGDHGRPECGVGQEGWNQKTARCLGPGNVHDHRRAEIGEQGEGEPSQHGDVASIGHEHRQDRAQRAERDHVEQGRSADQQSQRVGHCTEVGPDVDRVGDEKQRDDPLQQPIGIVLAQIAGDAFARRAADPGADLLDRCDQRVGEQHDPRDREPELGAGLAVGRDSAGVVV